MNRRAGLLVMVGACLIVGCSAQAQILMQAIPGRQVTMFGILAVPGGNRIDPKLKPIEPQLRKLFAGQEYSFRLLATDSRRLGINDTLTCKLGGG